MDHAARSRVPDGRALTLQVREHHQIAGEYGVHTDGQNQQSSDADSGATATWYMTWDNTNVYIGVTAANVAEGLVLYFDAAPVTPVNGGTNADGSLVGYAYDNSRVATLPFRADFVAYIKSTYNEYRVADGANGWGSPTTATITQVGSGSTREIRIPWSVIRSAGRPASFLFTGYVTSSNGFAYGEMPQENPGGFIGTNAIFSHFYRVTDATPGTGTKPFAMKAQP
jgi:hypothetical protein